MKKTTLLLILFAFAGMGVLNSCKEKNDLPEDNPIEEWLEIDGIKYIGDQIVGKNINEDAERSRLQIQTTTGQHPFLTIIHMRNPDDDMLVTRRYKPSPMAEYYPPFDLYNVEFNYAEGAEPDYCRFNTTGNSTGTYVLKKYGDKFLSDFSNISLLCVSGGGGFGSDTITVSGNLIWEAK